MAKSDWWGATQLDWTVRCVAKNDPERYVEYAARYIGLPLPPPMAVRVAVRPCTRAQAELLWSLHRQAR